MLNVRFRISIFFLGIIGISYSLAGQSEALIPEEYPGGIMLQTGLSSYAVRDRYYSPEKYSGMLPRFTIGWIRTHNRYVYHLNFTYGQAGNIMNNNVPTRIVNFKLSQGFLYPLKPVGLFRKDLNLWIGPTADIFYYESNPDLAISSFDYTDSYSTLVSIGFRSDGILSLSDKFRVRSSLQLSILSLGIRTIDQEENKQPGAKLLTPFSGLHGYFDIGPCYDVTGWLSLGISYHFELTRISAWEEILAASNAGLLGLYFRF